METKTLFEKINSSDYFLVFGTGNLLEDLKYKEEKDEDNIRGQVRIARQLKKEFIILIDKSLSEDEKRELEDYFIKDTVIGVIDKFNLRDFKDIDSAALAVRKLVDKRREIKI